MKEYHMYGWRVFVLFYVCVWKTHYLSPKQKEPFSTLSCGAQNIYLFQNQELRLCSLSLLHPFRTLRSEVNAQLVRMENVISCERILGISYKALDKEELRS